MTCSNCTKLKEAEEQASFWRNHAREMEQAWKALILEKKELVSKLEKLRKF